jgi:hypothetical protein
LGVAELLYKLKKIIFAGKMEIYPQRRKGVGHKTFPVLFNLRCPKFAGKLMKTLKIKHRENLHNIKFISGNHFASGEKSCAGRQ